MHIPKHSRVILAMLELSASCSLFSCAKTEVLNVSVPHLDTIATKAHRPPKPPRDTIQRQDTARVPIGWNVSVGDWEETEKDL